MTNMDRNMLFSAITFLLIIAAALSAPAPAEKQADQVDERQDLAASEKDDLKTAASHWGGHWGGYGGYGGYGGWGGYGSHWGYPGYYGSWGYPHYSSGYGYWPYGGYGHYGHGGYWW